MMDMLRILILDHAEADVLTILQELESGGFELMYEQVKTLPKFLDALQTRSWDIVLSSHCPPHYSALDALQMSKETNLDLPFIVLSGSSDEGMAVEVMRAGARDYILKNNLKRLIPAIKRELAEKNIRSAYRRADETIRYQSYHDALTRLPNRALFFDRLQQTILASHREQSTFSLLLISINCFTAINEELGHHNGDLLLRQLASRLRSNLRQSDTVARMGGIEFAAILPNIGHDKTLFTTRKLLDSIERPFFINTRNYYVSANIGITLYPKHGMDVDALILNADTAMQAAKRSNGGFLLYHDSQYRTENTHRTLASELHEAITANQLILYYQPKVEISTRQIIGVEALVRWQHPKYGFISPEEFIPLAEQTDIIKPLSNWVIKTALDQYETWKREGLNLKIAINISIKNLMDFDSHTNINQLLDQYELEPGAIELELTETTMMSEPETAMHRMKLLSQRGILFSIDDFGTGYSSLSYLKRLPVNILKIDKSFIQNMTTDDNDAVIVRATIDLAHNIGLKIVAEGVENKATWDLLEILRCDIAQGYYINPPLPPAAINDWVRQSQHRFQHAPPTAAP